MTDKDHYTQPDQAAPNPLLEQLRRDMHTPGSWPHRFQTLIEATLNVDSATLELTCPDVQSVLDAYIAGELGRQDVSQLYPDVRQHLQTCLQCQRDYEALLNVLLERDPQVVFTFKPAAWPLSFLHARDDNPLWVSRVQSRLAGASFGLQVLLAPHFLKSKLGFGPPPQLAEAYRSDVLPPSFEPRILLIDDVPFNGQRLNVEISVARAADEANRFALLATLVGSETLPDNLWMQLTLAEQAYAAPIVRDRPDEGHVQIDNVMLDDTYEVLNDWETRIEIVFEVRDTFPDDDHILAPA